MNSREQALEIRRQPIHARSAIFPGLRLAGILLALAGVCCFAGAGFAQPAAGGFDAIAATAAEARQRGDTARAAQLYEQAVGLNPQWQDGWWFLGVLRYGGNQFAAAADALTHYITLKPNAGAALALRGLCEFETGQFTEALGDLQRGIALGAAAQPRNAEILYYHEALLLTRVGRFEEAIGKYTVFVKEGKVNEDLTMAIGLAGLRIPLFPKDADPVDAQLIAMTGAAGAKVMNGDVDAGSQAFQEVFALFPKVPNVHYFYGYLLYATRPDAAIAQFRQELTISADSAPANAMLAWAYGVQGDYAAALPFAQKTVADDPSLAMGQLILGRSMAETGDVAGGLAHLEKVLQLEPANLEAHLTLAKIYSNLGRKDDARRERVLCLELAGEGSAPSVTP